MAESEGWPVGARESIDLIPFAYGSGAVGVNIAAQAVNSTSTEVLTGPVFIGNLGYDGGVEGIWLGLTSNDAGPTNYTLMTDGGRIWADGTNVPFLIGGDTTTRNLTVDGGLTVNGQASLFGMPRSVLLTDLDDVQPDAIEDVVRVGLVDVHELLLAHAAVTEVEALGDAGRHRASKEPR